MRASWSCAPQVSSQTWVGVGVADEDPQAAQVELEAGDHVSTMSQRISVDSIHDWFGRSARRCGHDAGLEYRTLTLPTSRSSCVVLVTLPVAASWFRDNWRVA